jgi:hypothetical protein
MIFMNKGCCDRIFDSEIPNRLFGDAIHWLGSRIIQ